MTHVWLKFTIIIKRKQTHMPHDSGSSEEISLPYTPRLHIAPHTPTLMRRSKQEISQGFSTND